MQNFQELGAPPQTPVPSAAGGEAPRPPTQPPYCEFLATRLSASLFHMHALLEFD